MKKLIPALLIGLVLPFGAFAQTTDASSAKQQLIALLIKEIATLEAQLAALPATSPAMAPVVVCTGDCSHVHAGENITGDTVSIQVGITPSTPIAGQTIILKPIAISIGTTTQPTETVSTTNPNGVTWDSSRQAYTSKLGAVGTYSYTFSLPQFNASTTVQVIAR